LKYRIIIYGVVLAALILALKLLQYSFIIRELTLEFYLGVVAVLFVALGAWVGARITSRKIRVVTLQQSTEFAVDEIELKRSGISKRELEVLELMSKGNSNQEIADKLFLSPNTVKTHCANLFVKLDVRRRTQAIQRAKDLRLIP
jgi:two-component system, NarL family, response regulator LiaR